MNLFEDMFEQTDQFVQDNAQLDLAWINNTLGELRHSMAQKAKEEYDRMVNKDDGENDTEEGSGGGIYETG